MKSQHRGKPTAEVVNIDVADRLQDLINALCAPSEVDPHALEARETAIALRTQWTSREEYKRAMLYKGWLAYLTDEEKVAYARFNYHYALIKAYIKKNKGSQFWSAYCTTYFQKMESDVSRLDPRLHTRAL